MTEASNTSALVNTTKHSHVRPWSRYWARLLDLCFFAFLCTILLAIVSPDLADSMSETAYWVLLVTLWIMVESVLMLTWGTTPGKALFSIAIGKSDGRPIAPSEALLRSFRVCWRGIAFGIPLISIVTLLRASHVLTNDGVTSWDRDGGFSITHGKISWFRLVLIVIMLGAYYGSVILDIFLNV